MTPPRQNRVTPFGEIEVSSARGSLMGNRGILHDAQERLGEKRWQHQSWVTCTLEAKGPKRPLAAPGHYTVLFFHDEAVALAAGHRPCAQCRREAYGRFVTAWKAGHGKAPEAFLSAKTIDTALHRSRVTNDRKPTRFAARLGDLPAGVFVTLSDEPERPFLLWEGHLHPWNHGGYGPAQQVDPETSVSVLTPASTVAVLQSGYGPRVAFAGADFSQAADLILQSTAVSDH